MVTRVAEKSLEEIVGNDNRESAEISTKTRKYISIANTIRQRITDGEYKPFQRLSKKQFVKEFGVSGDTVTEALSVLRGEGHIIGQNSIIYVSNPDSTNPITQLHEIVAYRIRKRIVEGVYMPGERIPTLSDLESDGELGASHVTVVRALDILKQEGLLVSERFRGIFVNPNYTNATTQYSK